MDRLEELSTFLRVAETGSFAAAAALLGVDRAVITRRINSLENKLGRRLLQRSTRRLALTPEGEAILEEAAALENHARTFFSMAQPDGLVGVVRVRCSYSLAAFGAARLFECFAEEHPGLTVEMQTSEKLSPIVETGADLVLKVTDGPEPGAIAHRLGPCDSIFAASPAYWKNRKLPTDPAAWNQLRLLPLISETDWLIGGTRVRLTAANAPVRYGSAWFAYEAALAGIGVARLPAVALREDLAAGRLLSLSQPECSNLAVWALLPSRRWIKPAVRELLERLRAHYGKNALTSMMRRTWTAS